MQASVTVEAPVVGSGALVAQEVAQPKTATVERIEDDAKTASYDWSPSKRLTE